MAPGGDGTGTEYVARDVLERVADNLTVEDVRRAREQWEDATMRGFGAIYYAAVRMGETDGSEDASSWLGRVRLRDLGPIMAAATATLPNAPSDGGSSPTSVASGG